MVDRSSSLSFLVCPSGPTASGRDVISLERWGNDAPERGSGEWTSPASDRRDAEHAVSNGRTLRSRRFRRLGCQLFPWAVKRPSWWGDRDLVTPIEMARHEASTTPWATLVVVAGAAHSVQLRSTNPAVLRVVSRFLLTP